MRSRQLCGDEDSCPLDARTTLTGTSVRRRRLVPYDAENDADSDVVCGDVDSCAHDAANDADSDTCAVTWTRARHDADNDVDSDAIVWRRGLLS